MRTVIGAGAVMFLSPILISLGMLGFTEALFIWLVFVIFTVIPLVLVVIVVARALRT